MIEMMGGKKTFAVIRAVYEHRYSPEDFVRELDFVLEKNVNVVIIEPDDLGEVTWRWIHTGNWLHKTAVISGLAAIAGTLLAFLYENRAESIVKASLISVPCGISRSLLPSVFFGLVSATSSSLYALFWQWDPCAKYQVAQSLSVLPACVVAAASGSSSVHPSPASSTESSLNPHDERQRGRCHNCSYDCAVAEAGELGQRPVVLIRRDDFYRKVLHNTVSVGAVLCVGLAVYRWRRLLRPAEYSRGLTLWIRTVYPTSSEYK
ncbi:Transmembrane protein [Echinococcus granulosus]|uniref:Transmembrane protein n=1 Tax=Echinococcus granulosus TaxID=6210 RepID=W6UWB7_ECHGR|nr:Transmembrane protein [Echinococcus granulosus]EUB62757.1 Transmembrane protein [Echinococcus granulosus]